jgi:Protein of unknown function (DUF3616)
MHFPISCGRALISAAVAALCALPAMVAAGNAEAASEITLTPMKLSGAFLGKKKKDIATDLSGIACMAPKGASRTCLAVNDENKNAQFLTIDGDQMTVGKPVTLIGDGPDKETLGSPPKKLDCSAGPGKYGDLDGEGVTFSAPYFYVVGSHGCSRNTNEFRLGSFILSQIRVDDTGQPVAKDAVQNTYRVSDILEHAGEAAKSFGKDLKTADGLNIEGIAADGDRLWFGLRAPLENGSAFVVAASVKDLFAAGHDHSKAKPIAPVLLALAGLGIRDLAVLPDKRLLVLAGAAEGPEVPFHVFMVNPADGSTLDLGALPAVTQTVDNELKTGKAEGITVLDMNTSQIRAAVLFDSLINGAPHMAIIPLK